METQSNIFEYLKNDYKNNNEVRYTKDKKVLSLFSGCGGMDIGFEGEFTCLRKSINLKLHPDWISEEDSKWVKVIPTGFKTVFANDIRGDAKAAWVSYFKKRNPNANNIYHLNSIVDLVKMEKEGLNIFPKNIDIVTGGFPCQDFSVAGKRKGFNSDTSHNGGKLEIGEPTIESRGQLYMWMREVISIVQPKMFIAENVKGLTTLENVQQIIEHDFSEAADGGYLVLPARILHAADYGVPQSRQRVIFIGFKRNSLKEDALKELSQTIIDSKYDPYPRPTHNFSNDGKDLFPFVTCSDAFIDLTEPKNTDDPSQKNYSKAKYMPKGQGNIEVRLDYISPTIRSEHHGNIEFRRLSFENGGKHIEELNLGLEQRRLSVRECARIQTFPDDYQFILPKTLTNKSVSASDAYKIIGNAVPCVLAYNIAMRISSNWDKYFK
jgi:DNA (cytosine-5)-methyltransferase 1